MNPRVWQDTMSLKTYPLGPDDPNPALQRQGGYWTIYPYTMRDDVLEGPGEPREYVALHVENQYLHCIVLPELGGHMYSLLDKVTGREVFYRNNVVKYGLVATRGAWISGGIEFNFPTGHTYTTVDPVSWELGGDDEQSWIAVGNVCRLSRMEWWVRLSLAEGERRLREEIYLENHMPYKQRHWFWNNTSVPARDDLRLVYPARKARVAGGIVDYPITEGRDISRYTAHVHADDIFTLGVTEDFFGCHYDDLDFGMVNASDHWDVMGRKYFTWGVAGDGMAWVDLLTDDDGQYVEIQSGRFETQAVWEFLQPQQQAAWEEHWFPVGGMGGWVWASDEAALNFELQEDAIRLGVQPVVQNGESAVLKLSAHGKTVWSHELLIDVAKPFVTEIPMPEGCDTDTEYVLALYPADCDEAPLIRYVHPPYHTRKPKVAETGENVSPAPKPEDECGAEELCGRADAAWRQLSLGEARRLYGKALEADEGFSAAHLGLGILDYQAALYESCAEHLQEAVDRNPGNGEAWYYLGLVRRDTGDLEAADLAFREAHRRLPGFPAIAAQWCGECPAGDGEPAEAQEALSPPPQTTPWGPYGLWRMTRDPSYYFSDTLDRFAHFARGDVQLWLESAFGCATADAVKVLELACDNCPGARTYPIVQYALGQWYAELGMETEAQAARARAKQCAPDFCFPSRVEELEILQRAVELDPTDWKARYYLGNVLAGLWRREEAMAAWREAEKLDDGFAVLQRNLGLGCAAWEEDPQQAAVHYLKAIERNPDDYRYYRALCRLYAGDLGKSKQEQLELLRSAPRGIQDKWQIAAMIAELLQGIGQYDEALALLAAHKFFPWEGATHMRTVYASCLTAKGEQAAAAGDHQAALAAFEQAMEYPRNLSVGRLHYSQDARVYWLAALQAEELGLEDKRRQYLEEAAGEPHRRPCEADAYKTLALRALGREQEAAELEAGVRQWAEELLKRPEHEAQGKRVLGLLGDR